MYDIALTVEACLRSGTRVDVAWAVQAHGFSGHERGEALAITPGGGRVGGVLAGSLDGQLATLVGGGTSRRLVDLQVSEVDAMVAGLSCGGDARCLVVPAADLPAGLWERLRRREPLALVTELDGQNVLGTTMFTAESIDQADPSVGALFARGVSDTELTAERVTTVLWPVPKLVVVGAGAIAEALSASAALLGWATTTATDRASATGLIAGLAVLDKVVVLSHDEDLGGSALAAALAGEVGYIGALGSRRTQAARADWLAYRGITDLSRVHGPAGLDIGAKSPAEIAVSIVAEAVATRAGKTLRRHGETGPAT